MTAIFLFLFVGVPLLWFLSFCIRMISEGGFMSAFGIVLIILEVLFVYGCGQLIVSSMSTAPIIR